MKLLGMVISSLNGKVYCSLGEELVVLEYCSPMFNDYGEWRVSLTHKKNFDIENIPNKKLFDIDLSKVDSNKLKEFIHAPISLTQQEKDEGFYLDEDNDTWEWDQLLTYVKYREPTQEEMEEEGNTIKDYNVGEFVYNDNSDLIPINDFKIDNEVQNIGMIFLKSVLENQDKIFSTEPQVFI
jgi:hypothetical protein